MNSKHKYSGHVLLHRVIWKILIKVEHFNNCLRFINFYFIKLKEQDSQQKLRQGKFTADIKCKHCVSIHVACDMFLVTFTCADIMNVSRVKITLKLTLSLRFFCMLHRGI